MLGLTREAVRHLVRRGVLTALDRDVFVVAASPDTFHRQIWCALLAAGPEAVASHRLAARLHGMRGFANEGIDVLLHERFHHNAPRGALHTTSWLPAEHLATIDGLPTTSPARTLFDLAGLSSPKRLRGGRPFVHEKRVARALDTAMSNGLPIAAVGRVLAAMGKRRRPGTTLMRELVAFTYRQPRLVIEADGRPYHMSLLDRDSDRWRDTDLVAAGWPVIRVTWRDLTHEPERFAAAVARVLGVKTGVDPPTGGATPSNPVRKRGR